MKSHREGMWTTCAALQLHSVASFFSALGMKADWNQRIISSDSEDAELKKSQAFKVTTLEEHLTLKTHTICLRTDSEKIAHP